MVGTDLKVISPAATEVLGPDVHRLATLHTNARSDRELLTVWLKSHEDGSPATRRLYEMVGGRFLDALAGAGTGLRTATVEHVQAALEAMRTKADGALVRPATVNTYGAAVKSSRASRTALASRASMPRRSSSSRRRPGTSPSASLASWRCGTSSSTPSPAVTG